VLSVKNDDLALRPGMTATARIVTARRENALLSPNAALRFSPPAAPAAAPSGSILSRIFPGPPRLRRPQAQAVPAPDAARQVWVLREGRPVAVSVQTGVSNGRQTEITGGELKAGMAVIVDYQGKVE
jgi:HlyD family secretion protein